MIVGTPITIGDFTSEGVFSIGAGGGCLGAHTGLVEFATNQIEELEGIDVQRVAVPWADTPPGVVCYNDLEAKPLDVLNGTEPGDSARAGERPDLEHIGVPIAPAAPDVTPQATEVLDFDPDVIVYSAQGSDCLELRRRARPAGVVDRADPARALRLVHRLHGDGRRRGDLAEGIYITGTENGVLADLDTVEGQHLENATTYQTKGLEYGMSEDDVFKGFAGQGFSVMMNIWEQASTIDGDITGEAIAESFASTDGTEPAFGGSPLNCAGAPEPYVAVCSSTVSITQWDGENSFRSTIDSPGSTWSPEPSYGPGDDDSKLASLRL